MGGHGIGEWATHWAGDGDNNVQGGTSTEWPRSHRTGRMNLAQPSLVVLGLAISLPAAAQVDIRTAAADATGSASAAHAHDNAALTSNPAAIGLARRYAISASGGFWNGTDWRGGVSAVDGMTTEGVALGVGYQRWQTRSELSAGELPGWLAEGDELSKQRRYDALTIGVAVPVADNRFSVGLNGSVLFVGHAVLGNATTGDVDVGIAGRPTEEWSVGLAVRNVLPQFFETDERIGLLAGTRYAWDPHTSVSLDVDVPMLKVDGLPVSIRGGAEWGDAVRHFGLGYRFEGPTSEHWMTLGAGLWSDPETSQDSSSRAGVNYALQIPLHGLDDDLKRGWAIVHTLSITIEPNMGDE